MSCHGLPRQLPATGPAGYGGGGGEEDEDSGDFHGWGMTLRSFPTLPSTLHQPTAFVKDSFFRPNNFLFPKKSDEESLRENIMKNTCRLEVTQGFQQSSLM